MKDTCQSCGKAIFWLAHERTGKMGPIEAEPNPKGNVRIGVKIDNGLFAPLDTAWTGVTHYAVLAKKALEQARKDNLPLFVSHFASCPNALHWKDREKTP